MIYLGSERVITNSFANHGTAEDYAGVHGSDIVMYGKGRVVKVIRSFVSHEDSINYNTYLQNYQSWKDGNYYNCISITGKNVRMRYDELGGNQVFIETYNGQNKLLFCFAHLDSVLVNVGDIIDSSTILGKQGNTGLVLSSKDEGDVTYGSHVHLEITDRNGVYIDPRKYAMGEIVTQYIDQSNDLDETKEQFRVMVDKINIRESATIESQDIGDVYLGELYTILDSTDDGVYKWYHIITALGVDGYVASKNGANWVEIYQISLEKEQENLLDVDPISEPTYKLLFTCKKDGLYYVRLYQGEELYIKELE